MKIELYETEQWPMMFRPGGHDIENFECNADIIFKNIDNVVVDSLKEKLLVNTKRLLLGICWIFKRRFFNT